MSTLMTESRFPDPDRAYRALIEAHRGLSDEQSAALNSTLVLILANHIGDQAVLQEALALAKQSLEQIQSTPEESGGLH
ncbi:DUF2783 domain-containing protein [Microvirga sp. 2MCAF35]|uniref:DUF2783 domain-containing protein n=1 Tax=Microvirga sp. 2MCAF35 TaxID=3232987 RepID=UPI003F9917CC